MPCFNGLTQLGASGIAHERPPNFRHQKKENRKIERGESITPPRPTGRRSNNRGVTIIRLMFKNASHIYKYTAISNNTICLLYVINKRVAQLVFKIILRCEKLAWYTNLWITDFRILVLSQNICFLSTTNLNSPLLMKQYSNDFKTFADKSN